jgi:hypothetical protein
MSPKYFALGLFAASSAFFAKAQDQGSFIPATKPSTAFSVSATAPSSQKKITAPCYCSANPEIVPLTGTETNRSYQGKPNASCIDIQTTPGGQSGPSHQTATFDSCKVSNVTYAWSITDGSSIATINGSNTNPAVNVLISGSGSFTLKLDVTVTCSDGGTCTASTTHSETVTLPAQKCECHTSPVSITSTGKQGNTWTYSGSAPGTCTGQSGTPPNLQNCQRQNALYQWSISGNVASIAGPNDQPTVSVKITGNGPFTLQLNITTVCSDGQRCTNYNSIQDVAKLPEPKHCSCNFSVKCQRAADAGGLRKYEGVLQGKCEGVYGPSAPYSPCGVNKVTWHWQINSGSNVIEFVGPTDQQTVSVRVKGNGKYAIEVQAFVECNDGTKECGPSNYSECEDSANENKKCSFNMEESFLPQMRGGLSEKTQKSSKIRRDEFVALIAEGKDYDKVIFTCTPSKDCDPLQKQSKREVLLAGKVAFEWEIESGEGNFVKLGFLPKDVKNDVGDRVIFQPPYVPLPKTDQPNTKTTVIRLRIVDETGVGILHDQNEYDVITITTKRSKGTDEDYYQMNIQSLKWTPPSSATGPNNQNKCEASSAWVKDEDLQKPSIRLPAVPDNRKMVLGQWMILEAANQNETDELRMACKGTGCGDDGNKKKYPDDIKWTWFIVGNDGKKGTFIGGNEGRYVIYAAPDKLPENTNKLTVSITSKVANTKKDDGTAVQFDDGEKTSDPVSFEIFKPGVRLEYPPLDWVPEHGNSVDLKSSLLHFENGEWKEALAHMGRIHFFELLNVSREKGICMNDPVLNKANDCRDLLLNEDDHTEVFTRSGDPSPFSCPNNKDRTNFYLHARSQKPQKEETVTVHSEDFGSYGFLRSFANINKGGRDSIKGELPVYEPVPVPDNEVKHPKGRARIKYKDNRVTVPRDVDENHIPDGGWLTTGSVRVEDPVDPQKDDDNQPVGDGFKGDGLSNYEEYRGFMVKGQHVRTHTTYKDLFIYNPGKLVLETFELAASEEDDNGIETHEINEVEYINNATREVNFNFNPKLHPVAIVNKVATPAPVQKGLYLHKGTKRENYLGKTESELGKEELSPPNWTKSVNVYADAIKDFCKNKKISFNKKLMQVTAHELCHALNVYHHGDNGMNNKHSLRSGSVRCIMRYDNEDPVVQGLKPERIGDNLCRTTSGNGYNSNDAQFGNCAAKRGRCFFKLRVSGVDASYPKY